MDASQMLSDFGGPKCEKATITPGSGQYRLVGPWERYWRHWVTDTVGRTHFIPCAGPKSTCKLCAYVRANWESNPEVRQYKAGSSALFNVIDRRDNWCKDNKHTKILCQWKSEIGIGPMMFDELKEVVNINGPWEGEKGNWDMIVVKSGSGPQGTTYKCQATREKIELTDEEKSYEKYDLKLLMPPAANPEEVQELIDNLNGKSQEVAPSTDTSAMDALTVDALKKEIPTPSAPKVEKKAEVAAPAVTKLAPKKTVTAAPVVKKDNVQKCETENCKGILEFNNSDKEVTCPSCKSTFELAASEENPFEAK